MLSARAYSFRQKSRLAISLSWIGGYTNVIALLAAGIAISHVTGSATHFGEHFVGANWNQVIFFGFILITFLLGAMLSALLIENARRRGRTSKYIAPMLVEAVLLALFALGVHYHNHVEPAQWMHLYWMTGVASVAMGLQNATITRISGAVIRTTHLTGVVTDLGLESVQLALRWRERTRGRNWQRTGRLLRISQRHPNVQRVLLLVSVFGSFLFGVVAGAWMFAHWPTIAMIPPVAFLIWIVFVDWYTPIADVREIDQLSDPELKTYGLIKSLLPPEMGIYRLWCHRHNMEHDAPNFQFWAEMLPEHRRVVILAISPLTRLDTNAVLGLKAALEYLSSREQRLILAGVTQSQFQALSAEGFERLMSVEDLCPDLEFAIARGIALVRETQDVSIKA